MADQMMIKRCNEMARIIRRHIIDMTYNTGKTGAQEVCLLLNC